MLVRQVKMYIEIWKVNDFFLIFSKYNKIKINLFLFKNLFKSKFKKKMTCTIVHTKSLIILGQITIYVLKL